MQLCDNVCMMNVFQNTIVSRKTGHDVADMPLWGRQAGSQWQRGPAHGGPRVEKKIGAQPYTVHVTVQ